MFRHMHWFVFLTLAVCGCQSRTAPAPAAAVNAKLASWAETEQLIASHKGKVVVLDVWSTWCAPCVAEFPGLAKLHQQYPGKVACISLNANYTGGDEPPGADREQIEAFLAKSRATFDNLICTDPDERLYQSLEAAAVPVVRVYDRTGQLRKQFDNDENEFGDEGFSYERHVGPLVEKLLKE